MNEAQIKHMAERFLMWKLPDGFNPDGGIVFDKVGNEGSAHEYTRVPVGTNLLDYMQASQMVRHMLEGLPGGVSGESVCLAIAPSDDGDEYAVFSSPDAGTEWANARPQSCVIVYPMVVDVPEFGDTPANSTN